MKRYSTLLGITCLLCMALVTVPDAIAAIVPSPLVKLTALTDREVQNPRGDHLGQIEDIVLDAGTGQIAYAVLSFGGFLGLGETWVVMPWSALQTMNHGETFTLDMSEEQLQNAPNFKPDQWPDMEDRHWGDTIHAYYGKTPYWGQRLPAKTASDASEAPPLQLLRTSQALRHEVINTRGQHIGAIEDIMIDAALGDIAYAVLSFGGFLGLGEKWFAIPWGAFEPSAGFRTLTLDVSKDALQKAPGFDQNDWPEMSHRRWAATVHDAFDQAPYWERQRRAQAMPESADKVSEAPTKQPPENAGSQAVSQAPVTVTNARGTVMALIGPVTLACQPQRAVAGDVPAIAQANAQTLEAKRELLVKRQNGKMQIGCSRPASPSDNTTETSKTQP